MIGRIGKRKGVTIKYTSFEFGDTCREALEAGVDIELLAKLLKRKPNTIEKWVQLANTFSPEYRFEDINPSYYEDIVKAPDPLKAAQFIHDEYERGYPMCRPNIRIFVDEWNKRYPRPFIMANYGEIDSLYRWGKGGKCLKGLDDEGVAREMGLPVGFIVQLRLQREGKIPEFINTQDTRIVDYIIALQQHIDELEQKLPRESIHSEVNEFINRMEKEPENHTVELKIIHKTGRPAINIDMNKFIALYTKGLTDGEIATRMKISRPTVIRRREELGLKPNRTSGQRGPSKKAQGE